MSRNRSRPHVYAFALLVMIAAGTAAAQPQVPRYGIHEVIFEGPTCSPTDAPARDIVLTTQWQHTPSGTSYTIHGFWDADGRGGATGNIFKVRLCPTQQGPWKLVTTSSNRPKLNRQKEGLEIICTPSDHPGFWEVDHTLTASRWYRSRLCRCITERDKRFGRGEFL